MRAVVLSSVPTLLCAARLGSATRAAAELRTTPATVLRTLTALEDALAVRLFDRTPSGLLPTPALELVLPWAEQAHEAAARLVEQLQGMETRPVGTVRLAALPAVASLFLAPAIRTLRRAHPELVVELAPETAVVDLVMREADIAVRALKPTTGDLIVQRLATFRLAVVVSPTLKRSLAKRTTLAQLPWLTWTADLGYLPEARWLTEHVPAANVVLRCSELEPLLRAAQDGLGALVVAEPIAARAGRLVRAPVQTPALPEGALWLVAHRALRPVPRVAAVWDWLAATFRGELTLPQG